MVSRRRGAGASLLTNCSIGFPHVLYPTSTLRLRNIHDKIGGKAKEKSSSMPKRATTIMLSEKEQEGLHQIIRRHRSEQQVVLRARIVLAAA
jgi:hypothetical protein